LIEKERLKNESICEQYNARWGVILFTNGR
jgi:hypothetical protein